MPNQPPLACPIHKVPFESALFCRGCDRHYPTVRGVPVLINDAASVFATADYAEPESAYEGASGYAGNLDQRSGLRQFYRRLMHRLLEAEGKRKFGAVEALSRVHAQVPDAKILVVGAGDTRLDGNVTYTDVAFGRNVTCIADAHDLPFEGASFDACFACAVLEHVADPSRCVQEIARVLKPRGFVFAETPFLQPVHMGAHDFTRFTFLGHRRLFRQFDEIESGIAAGPATSAAHALRYLLTSLAPGPLTTKWLRMIGILASQPLRQLDRLALRQTAAYDSASGFYFFGMLRPDPIPDRHILQFYRGG